MKIRSYKGTSLGSIYEAISKDLGPKAVVVCPESTGGHFSNMFSGKRELIAVVDDGSSDNHLLQSGAGSDEILKEISNQKVRQKEMERIMRDLRDEVACLVDTKEMPPAAFSLPPLPPAHAAGWDGRFLANVSSELPEALVDHKSDETLVGMAKYFKTGELPVQSGATSPAIVVLTGPTGSGKTTTMAKLAAEWCLERRMKVGLITADTYRVAAIDQTREYAELLGLHLKVVFSPEEMKRAVAQFAGMDVILVDTPGRSHLDESALDGLKGLMDASGALMNLVLVPAATRAVDVADILERFGGLASSSYVVVTKLDETREFSVFTTVASTCQWPIAYVTDGQRVPNDIHAADSMKIAAAVLGVNDSRRIWNDGNN